MSHSQTLRLKVGVIALLGGALAFVGRDVLESRVRAVIGVGVFILCLVAFSSNPRGIRWRTVAWGGVLQIGLAFVVLKFSVLGVRPGYAVVSALATAATHFLEFSRVGAKFVFGVLADPVQMSESFQDGFVLAFASLPIIVFVSSFFTLLYYVGLLQLIVKVISRVMMPLMGTSGAETLSAASNVFMGQTEAPIIVKPYIAGMTRSELLAVMVGGLSTVAGSVFAIYVGLGADPVAMLTTSVMAAPCGLYVAKILLPETDQPLTSGNDGIHVARQHANVIDAISSGAADGTRLAINVAGMLIAFLAFIAMIDFILDMLWSGLSLAGIFSVAFAPVAALMGIPVGDIYAVADLLGTKLATNEFVAYIKLGGEYKQIISERGQFLATFALTGFANFGSIGILLGGIGGMAPERRGDLGNLSMRALLGGFVVTLINASIAAIML